MKCVHDTVNVCNMTKTKNEVLSRLYIFPGIPEKHFPGRSREIGFFPGISRRYKTYLKKLKNSYLTIDFRQFLACIVIVTNRTQYRLFKLQKHLLRPNKMLIVLKPFT